MEKTTRKPVAPFYAVAVVWLAYAMLFPLHEPMQFGLLTAVSVAVFFAVALLCRSGPNAQAKPAKPTPKEGPKPTGNPALDKIIKDGRLAVAEMKRLDENIADIGISADIVRLEEISQKIFEQVTQDPTKLPQIRRFMDYYLPTTLKLLNAYDRASSAGISGDNVDATIAKVETMMRTIVVAFEKQLDALFGSEALDISTDITVLEGMMMREGLSEDPLKATTSPPGDGEIHLNI